MWVCEWNKRKRFNSLYTCIVCRMLHAWEGATCRDTCISYGASVVEHFSAIANLEIIYSWNISSICNLPIIVCLDVNNLNSMEICELWAFLNMRNAFEKQHSISCVELIEMGWKRRPTDQRQFDELISKTSAPASASQVTTFRVLCLPVEYSSIFINSTSFFSRNFHSLRFELIPCIKHWYFSVCELNKRVTKSRRARR